MGCEAPRDSKEHDACLQDGWLKTFLAPVTSALPSLAPADACALIAEGNAIEDSLFSRFKRQESRTNIAHTQVWPNLRSQLQTRCAAVGPPPAPALAGGATGSRPGSTPPAPSIFGGVAAPGQIVPGLDNTTLIVLAVVAMVLLSGKV